VPLPGDLVQGLRSLDEGFIPDVFDESVIDRKVLVDSESAFAGARELAEQEGVFAGISSGAVLRAAQEVARTMESGNVLLLVADGGWKYLSTSVWTRQQQERSREAESKL